MLDSKFWAKYFKVYDVLNSLITYQELLDAICDELDIKKGEKILEAGCGTGNLALKMKERGADVTGIDNCQEALGIYLEKDPSAKVFLADLKEKLPFPDNYFNKIASNNTLYALSGEKQLKTMEELYRILKKEGQILISNPLKNSRPVYIYFDEIAKGCKRNGFIRTMIRSLKMIKPTVELIYYNSLIVKEAKNGYFNFFEIGDQKKMLERANFRNISNNKIVYSGQAVLNKAAK
ncbi:MAG: methyltransferase domain-containing protein [Candidatus Paceibacterota bacterium]|jgi:ubiquinone/menaquinone biosynthesis C-methylase UbiE